MYFCKKKTAMTENFDHKIQRLELENFTCFAHAQFDFSSGINVFIGENGTGKTHVLKVLYSLLRKGWVGIDGIQGKEFRVAVNFMEVFKFDDATLFQKLIGVNGVRAKTRIYFDPKSTEELNWIDFEMENEKSFKFQSTKDLDEKLLGKELLFIPTIEMLSYVKGFIYTYERGQNAFDGTYLDLVKALDGLPLHGHSKEEINLLLEDFEDSIKAKVYKQGDKFYFKFDNLSKEVEAPMAAEGIKKLAQLIYLVKNGTLNKDTILFLDEPEINLNPRYIKIVAQFLQTLAKHGVQIFVATHDYLLTYLLSLDAEYPKADTPPMRFFSLYKGNDGTAVEWADTMNGIKNNSILEEYGAYHDLMMSKAFESLNTTPQ